MPLLNEKTVNDILIVGSQQTNGSVGCPVPGLEAKQKMLDSSGNTGNDVEIGDTGPPKRRSIAHRIPAFGLLMSLMSVFCFSIGSVIVKVLTEMHSIQVLVIRCIFQFIFYTITTMLYKYPLCGRPGHRIDLLLRCISGTISLIAIFMAYRLMPLADASTIHFSSPVFVTVFAYILLKEPITVLQAITGTITLTGVVIIAKPEFLFGSESESIHESRLLGTILASVAAMMAAFSMVNLRKLKTTPVAVVVMWYSATVIITGMIILLILNKLVVPTGLVTWALLVGIGFCGIGDQFFLTVALKYETAGPVSVTRTFNIVLSFIWEIVLLSESIEWTSVLGACLVSSCVIILAVVKWKEESPELFDRITRKLFCGFRCCTCCRSDKHVKGLNAMPSSLRASNESIDESSVQSPYSTVHSNVVLLRDDK